MGWIVKSKVKPDFFATLPREGGYSLGFQYNPFLDEIFLRYIDGRFNNLIEIIWGNVQQFCIILHLVPRHIMTLYQLFKFPDQSFANFNVLGISV